VGDRHLNFHEIRDNLPPLRVMLWGRDGALPFRLTAEHARALGVALIEHAGLLDTIEGTEAPIVRAPLPDLSVTDPEGHRALSAHLRHCKQRGLRKPTLEAREEIVRRFARLTDTPLLEVTQCDVDRWRDTYDDHAPATIENYARHVQTFYGWLTKAKLIADDPTTEIPIPKVLKGVPRPIEEVDLHRAVAAATGELRVWLVLAAYVGLRAGEISRLRREDIYETRDIPVLHVVNGKGGRERLVPLSGNVLHELGYYLTKPRGPQWLSGYHDPDRLVTVEVAGHLRALGIPATCHSLRHCFATRLYQQSGGDLRMTQDLMGHASPATTAIYAAWDPTRATPVVNAMAAGLLAETVPGHIPRTCDHCGNPLAERARVDARFCKATCRVASAAIDRSAKLAHTG